MLVVRSTAPSWTLITEHLRGAPERVLFLAAVDAGGVATVHDHLLMEEGDIELGLWCVQLTDDAQQKVFRWAADRDGWLIEIHSHLGPYSDPAEFSPTDTLGLKEWVPYVRWRLRQRPYAALVFGPETLDGVAWTGPKNASPSAISGWDVDGAVISMTGRSLAAFEEQP